MDFILIFRTWFKKAFILNDSLLGHANFIQVAIIGSKYTVLFGGIHFWPRFCFVIIEGPLLLLISWIPRLARSIKHNCSFDEDNWTPKDSATCHTIYSLNVRFRKRIFPNLEIIKKIDESCSSGQKILRIIMDYIVNYCWSDIFSIETKRFLLISIVF